MKHAGAGILALATLCAGCAERDYAWRDWTGQQDLLALDEALDRREYHRTHAYAPYWRQADNYDPRPHTARKSRARLQPTHWQQPVAAAEPAAATLPPPATPALESAAEPASASAEAPAEIVTAMRDTADVPVAAQTGDEIGCLADDAACRERLAELLSDRARVWMLAPARATDYASGVRLFAFYSLRDTLTCTELRFGVQDAGATLDHLATVSRSDFIGQSSRARLALVRSAALRVLAELEATHLQKCPARLEPSSTQ